MYVLLEKKMAAAREREREKKVCSKKWFQLRLFRDDYLHPICTFSPCWQYAGNVLGLVLFLYLFWLTEIRSQVMGMSMAFGCWTFPSFFCSFLAQKGMPGDVSYLFRAEERIWPVESIEKPWSWQFLGSQLTYCQPAEKPLYKCVLISCFRSLCFVKLLSPTEILLGHSQARKAVCGKLRR